MCIYIYIYIHTHAPKARPAARAPQEPGAIVAAEQVPFDLPIVIIIIVIIIIINYY